MAFMVARTEKRKIGSLGGYQNHVDRKTDNHSNKDIDNSKTYLNYDLVGHEADKSFHKEFMDYINENRVGSRAVRKDAVVMQDWIIGSSQEFFDALTPGETRKYFETAVEFFAEKFGRENIRFATVHMDEKTPHMHMGIVPLKDGKLTAKTIFDRNCLRMIQDKLPQAFQKAGFDIQRGEPKSEKVHLHPEEFKATIRAAEDEAKEIKRDARQQAENHIEWRENIETKNLADDWADEWLETKQVFPDFNMKIEVYEDDAVPRFVDVDENTPKTFKFDFEEIMNLFKEKFTRLKAYIAFKWQNLSRRESEIEKRENTLIEKETSLESKIEVFKDKEQKFINLDKDLTKYKVELVEQIEPIAFATFSDREATQKVLDYWRNDASLEHVLGAFSDNFLGYDIDTEKIAEIDKNISKAQKALELWEDAKIKEYPDYNLRDIRNLGFRYKYGFGEGRDFDEVKIEANKKALYLYVPGVDDEEWSDLTTEQYELFEHFTEGKDIEPCDLPWSPYEIKDYLNQQENKKLLLKSDKTNFVSRLHETVKKVEKAKENKALELAKKAVTRGFGRSR